ncbi:hypothetical protein GCM10019016_068450 [Streptomyces prasinosporus]|uniref:Uncharacterized protein n=1 Tax=Streptomyces prasinosporus TaxID=68256 RepID=A0ABP6TZK6_9ACTN
MPGAAARVVRAAARRRAVRLALVAGAVFLFGVLCGEQARASDGPPFAGGVVRGDAGGRPVRVRAGRPHGGGGRACGPEADGECESPRGCAGLPARHLVRRTARGWGGRAACGDAGGAFGWRAGFAAGGAVR